MKASNEKILDFRRNYEKYVSFHVGEFHPFLYALEKMYGKTKQYESAYQLQSQKLNLKHCHQNNGKPIMDTFIIEKKNGEKVQEQRLGFTVDGQIKLNQAQRDLLDKEIEFQEHVCMDVLPDINFRWWAAFSPFVLPENPDEQTLEKLYQMKKVPPVAVMQNGH